jgi:hypothetical protein
VRWYQTAWQLARDILLTGTGLWLIISQDMARDPSSTLVVAGLALIVPAAAEHARTVLSGPSSPAGHGQPPSSSSSSSPPPSPPAPSSEGPGEPAGG